MLSDSLWFSGADPFWAAKRFVLGCQKVSRKVPPRLHESCASFVICVVFCDPVICMVFWGRSLSFPKRFCGGFPDHFFTFASQFFQLSFCIFPQQCQLWGLQPFQRSWGNMTRLSYGFFAANGFRLPNGSLECSPTCSVHSSQSLPRFLG